MIMNAGSSLRRVFSIHGFILLISFLLLAPVILTTVNFAARAVLLGVFIFTAVLVWRSTFRSYLLFVALYPLVPSHLSQLGLPEFSAVEFLFLSFAFWWAVFKLSRGGLDFPAIPLRALFGFQFLFLCLSTFFTLFATNLLLSRIFFLQLQEHSNFLFPVPPYDSFVALHALLVQSEGILFFFITLDSLDSSDKVRRTCEAIFYSAVVVSVLGLVQYGFHFRLLDSWVRENPNLIRINSTLDDPNSLGAYLAVAFCLGAFSVSSGTRVKTVVNVTSLILIFAALLFTGSRSALGAVLIVAFVIPLILKYTRYRLQPETPVAGLITRASAVIVLIVLLLITISSWRGYSSEKPSSYTDFIMSSFNPRQPVNTILKGRTHLWRTALGFFERDPVFGGGLGSFFYRISKRPYDFPELRVPENVHNYYLQLLAETGLIGFLLFFAIILRVLVAAFRSNANKTSNEAVPIFGLIGGLLVFLLTSITGHPLLLPKMQYLFWGLAAMSLAAKEWPGQANEKYVRPFLFILTGILLLGLPWHIISTERSRQLSAYEIGYYGWERDRGGQLFRWTKQEGISDLVVQGTDLFFAIRQIEQVVRQRTESTAVDIYVNNTLREHVVLKDSGWKDFRYAIDPAVQGKRIQLEIRPVSLFYPREFGLRDRRQLGVQVTPFRWNCPSGRTDPAVFVGVLRGPQQVFRLSAIGLQKYEKPEALDVTTTGGLPLSYRTDFFPMVTAPSQVVVLYSIDFSKQDFSVDATNKLVTKKALPPGEALFRIIADASPKGTRIPVLYGFLNGKLSMKVPIFRSGWTAYYAQLRVPGGVNEFSFSTWDGLSPVTKRIDTEIRIRDMRAWGENEYAPYSLQPAWFESPAFSEVLFDSQRSSPLTLYGAAESFSTEKNWKPGKASLVVSAKGELAGKDFPELGVYLAGAKIGSLKIISDQPRDYSMDLTLIGRESLRVGFENDYYDPSLKEDRNIVIYGIRLVNHPSIMISEPLQDLLVPGDACFLVKWKAR